MFEVALLFMIAKGVFEFCKYVSKLNANDRAKQNNVSKDGLTYVDNQGRMRLMSNNHIVTFEHYKGQYILRDLKTYDIVRNYTQEKKTAEYLNNKKKAEQEGKTVFCIDSDKHQHDKIKGKRYLDTETNQIYVIRAIGKWRIPFYMDLNGNMIKPVDPSWQPPKVMGIDDGIKINIQDEFNKYLQLTKDENPIWKAHNELWNEWLDI